MRIRGKIYKQNIAKVDRTKRYPLVEALSILEALAGRKFDETVEVALNLGVDPKQSDQQVRGAAVLPHGLGKTVRVVAIVKGEAEKAAKDAGADFIGHMDLIEKIEKGWIDFDRVLATPDTVRDLTKIAKVLGPKGLMPNKKTGTVADDIGKAVSEQKKGKVEFRVDKAGIVHAIIGKKSFGSTKLKENFFSLYDAVLKQKPATSKGIYIRRVSLCTTMGPGISLDVSQVDALARAS